MRREISGLGPTLVSVAVRQRELRVQVRAEEKPVENAQVVVAGATHRTDPSGTTTVTAMPGTIELMVVKSGFAPATASVQVAAGGVQEVIVELQPSRPSKKRSLSSPRRVRTNASNISRCAGSTHFQAVRTCRRSARRLARRRVLATAMSHRRSCVASARDSCIVAGGSSRGSSTWRDARSIP
jgi:hypothetical protein